MAIDKDLVEETVERLGVLGPVTTKYMFGGAGFFVDGQMFAKMSGAGVLALKADDKNRQTFLEAGMIKSGKMPYYEVTADQMEDDDALLVVAALAMEAARR